MAALRQAIDPVPAQTGLVHHSDRGVQYAAHSYAALLEEYASSPA